MAIVGHFSLILALAFSVYGIVAFIIAVQKKDTAFLESAKGGTLAVALLSTVAIGGLMYYLMSGDYSIEYVYEYTSNDLPVFYRISALWAGNAGSLLLWQFLLAWYAVSVAFSKKAKHLTPYATAILLINSAFFTFILAFYTDPFVRVNGWQAGMSIPDGAGMNPMLQNPGMVFHPVTTYLGYVGFAVPFAYAMTALLVQNADDEWIKLTRRWTIIAWMFLSLGNLWGAEWAYMELGWGGYWAWDPVENASFMPWLTGSAFLHSVMIQERKDMLKVWNVSLIAITYVLTLFGTYLVRSGVISSVHAFPSGPLGRYFMAFTLFALVASVVLIIDRRKLLTGERGFESLLSKEISFLINNIILVGLAAAVFLGTMFPKISELWSEAQVTLGAQYFNTISAPLGVALFLLMGVCPLIAWRRASWKNLRDSFLWPFVLGVVVAVILYFTGVKKFYSLLGFAAAVFTVATIGVEVFRGMLVRARMTGESYPWALANLLVRNRRRHGGYIIHLGLVLMLVAIVGTHTNNLEVTKTLKPGESINIGSYNVSFSKLAEKDLGNGRGAVYADMPVYKNGAYVGKVEPQQVFYPTSEQPAAEVGLRSTLKEDLYVILAGWEQDGSATFKVFVNPLQAWMWYGGYVLVFGTLFALWPGKGSQTGSKYVRSERLQQN